MLNFRDRGNAMQLMLLGRNGLCYSHNCSKVTGVLVVGVEARRFRLICRLDVNEILAEEDTSV